MIKITTLIATLLLAGCSSTPYVKIGAGYKVQEIDIKFKDGSATHPISARIEAGIKQGDWTYGVSHHSQWFTGKPFNDNMEYSKTELFVDYIWEFK